jgi:2-hydroxychromene-2-carboxylate isomerase
MSKTIDFYFDFASPTSYLAYTQLPGIAAEAGAAIVYQPVLLGGIFQATGNLPPISVPGKQAYIMNDLKRFAARYGVRFNVNPHFPLNSLQLMRGATGLLLRNPGDFDTYVRSIFRAMWLDQVNLGDQQALAAVLRNAGLDPVDLASIASDPAVKDRLKANTEAAVQKGLFGVPTFFVGEDMFFGQDRLSFVREALA